MKHVRGEHLFTAYGAQSQSNLADVLAGPKETLDVETQTGSVGAVAADGPGSGGCSSAQLVQLVALALAALPGTCKQHGQRLQFEGRGRRILGFLVRSSRAMSVEPCLMGDT